MLVELAFGEGQLPVELPEGRTTVVRPDHLPAAADERAAIAAALARPVAGPRLRELARPGQKVAVSICDGTRPQPRQLVVPALLDELVGIVDERDVVLLVATGTHRGNTEAELVAMLGRELYERVEVVNHDARDDASLVSVGTHGAGVPVWLNRRWVEADLRITTGFVEPHFFAGFSGGPKLVAPGLAGLETTLVLHDAARIGHPQARWGVIHGNPVHDDVRAIAAATGVDFSLDVVLDGAQRVVRAFAGELGPMHEAACELARRSAMQRVPRRYEVVVTSNAGFPLDQNLYQAVKGISAAAQVVAPGGTIVCAAECRDGFPDHGPFRDELAAEATPELLLARIAAREGTVPDQWQVQILAGIASRADVVIHTARLEPHELAEVNLAHTDDVERTVVDALGAAADDAEVCVLPEGPITIPYVD
ncbi:MAG: nickel-dependent lactate racemase [Gaiellales bacterium]